MWSLTGPDGSVQVPGKLFLRLLVCAKQSIFAKWSKHHVLFFACAESSAMHEFELLVQFIYAPGTAVALVL